jgi:uncharacterized protein (TIGR03067 family)
MDRPIALVALVLLLPASAIGDTCIWLKHAEAKSHNGRYAVRLDRSGGWKGRLEDTKTGKVTEAAMAGLGPHAHFAAFVTDDGSRVVVFEPLVHDTEGGNLLVYDRDLTLLKGFSLMELLTDVDFKAVRHSISHCRFTGDKKDGKRPFWLEDDGTRFSVYLKSKRTAIVSLAEPKIIPTPDVIPEVFEFEQGPPPGQTDRERFQGRWMITDARAGTMGIDPDSFTDDPRYYTFAGMTILAPGHRFDRYTFRLDESVTPHAIDLFEPGKEEPVKGIYEFRGGKLMICAPDRPEKPRPKTLDARGLGVDDWTETLQRRTAKR